MRGWKWKDCGASLYIFTEHSFDEQRKEHWDLRRYGSHCHYISVSAGHSQANFEPVQPWVTTKQSLSNYGYAAKMTYEATKSRHGPTSTPLHSGITMGMTTAHCPSQPPHCQVTRSCGSFTCCRGQSKFLPSVRCCSVRGKFTVSWEFLRSFWEVSEIARGVRGMWHMDERISIFGWDLILAGVSPKITCHTIISYFKLPPIAGMPTGLIPKASHDLLVYPCLLAQYVFFNQTLVFVGALLVVGCIPVKVDQTFPYECCIYLDSLCSWSPLSIFVAKNLPLPIVLAKHQSLMIGTQSSSLKTTIFLDWSTPKSSTTPFGRMGMDQNRTEISYFGRDESGWKIYMIYEIWNIYKYLIVGWTFIYQLFGWNKRNPWVNWASSPCRGSSGWSKLRPRTKVRNLGKVTWSEAWKIEVIGQHRNGHFVTKPSEQLVFAKKHVCFFQ